MLQIRPNCECCNKDLLPTATDAVICSFECTYCLDCSTGKFAGLCPNCGGELLPRPIRPASMLEKHPASTERVYHPEKCAS